MRTGTRALLLGGAALALVAGLGVVVTRYGGLPVLPAAEHCTAALDGHEVELDVEQAENAALIAAHAVRRGLPPRAASIALATAYQESDLYNLGYGDRDSVGLFQQRPSQGWGTRAQLLDPAYSTNAFYDALVDVAGYESMVITEAAQAVQRSGFPDAYADHEQDARVLATALTGQTTGGIFSCRVDPDREPGSQRLGPAGLVEDAARVRRDLESAFGDLALGGFQAGGVTSGHMAGSTHYEGRAVDAFFRPVSPANRQRGWAVAAYLVANADRLGVQNVIFDDRIWTSGARSGQGWRDYRVPSSSGGNRRVLEHRDHVHVDVPD